MRHTGRVTAEPLSPRRLGLRFSSALVLWTLLVVALPGCSDSVTTIESRERAEFDEQVEGNWKKKWAWVDAIPFLEKGGEYIDSGEPGAPIYDKPLILPLLKKLAAVHHIQWFALVDKKKRKIAVAVIGQFPDSPDVRQAVLKSLDQEQETFKLDILVQQGNRWMLLDFLSEEDAKFLSDTPPKQE